MRAIRSGNIRKAALYGAVFPVLIMVAAAPLASAHALLLRAEPAVGGVIAAVPTEIRLVFSEGLDVEHTELKLSDQSGALIPVGPFRLVVRREGERAQPGPVYAIDILKPLGAGSYRVRWRVLSEDGHETEGAFEFRVPKR